MKQVQWFPGHMAKAIKEMESLINSVDIVIELVDSRCPLSSSNPLIKEIASRKKILKIMSKADLANANTTNSFVNYFNSNNQIAIAGEINKISYDLIKSKCRLLLKEKIEKDKLKGLRQTPIKALIVGIPNVGKSTLINRLAKRASAKTENRPGVTKTTQYIKVDEDFILLDTPGILWPSFEDKIIGYNLALIGSIKQDILPIEEVCYYLVKMLVNKYSGTLEKHYGIDNLKAEDDKDIYDVIYNIAKARNFMVNNDYDINRAIIHILKEFMDGKLGKISLEEVSNG